MYCSKCGYRINPDDVFCPKCGVRIYHSRNNYDKNGYNERYYDNDLPRKDTRHLVLIIAGLTVVIIIVVFALVMLFFPKSNRDDNSMNNSVQITPQAMPSQTIAPTLRPLPTLLPKSELSGQNNAPKVTSPPKAETEVDPRSSENTYSISGRDMFDFEHNKKGISKNPSYSGMVDERNLIYCPVPDNFYYDGYNEGHYYYRAKDETALIIITAKDNTYSGDPNYMMSDYINEVGGYVDYKKTGPDWFAVSAVKGNRAHYIKCYTDRYLRAFEMIFPDEYSYVYDGYIEYMEKNFRRVN